MVFVYASGAQAVLSRGEASSVPGRALASGVGLMLAVYCGMKASGPCVNPCIALMVCMTGNMKWKKYPLYVVCEFTGAFLAAALTFGVYKERIDNFDGGRLSVYGINATSHIFTSYPADDVSKTTGFFDVAVGCGLLTSTTLMIVDPNNANPASGVAPIALVFMLYGIIMSFGINTGAPINLSLDFSGRLFAYCVGYGQDVFTRGNYWFWIPPAACVTGTLCFVTMYQLMVGNHLPGAGVGSEPETRPTSADTKEKAKPITVESSDNKGFEHPLQAVFDGPMDESAGWVKFGQDSNTYPIF